MYNCSWDDGIEDLEIEFDINANLELGNITTGILIQKHQRHSYYFQLFFWLISTGEPAKYHIYHDYTSAGVYDVSCTLYNMVSLKTITKTVSIKMSF